MSQTKAQLIDAVDGSIVTADIADDAVNADKLASNSVVSASIVDGSIVNADVNASAAIAGSKISPDFGSQNIVTTGTLGCGQITTTANIELSSADPIIAFTDTNNNDDFSIRGGGGFLKIRSDTDSADRLVVDSSGNVGIGTTTVDRKLHVKSSGLIAKLESTTANSLLMFATPTNESANTIPNIGADDNDFAITTGNVERLRVASSGNVGIGTASPSQLLEINGASNPAVLLKDTTNNVISYLYSQDLVGAVGTASNHPFVFNVNNGEKMRIDSSGRLLVGTTTALNASADDLVIGNGVGTRGITVFSANANDGNIFFADGTSGSQHYSGFLQYSHAQDEIRIGTSGDNALFIKDVSANRDVHIVTGDLVFDVAGRGIDFSADGNVSGATSELFDDYEEGTFTPAMNQGINVTSYTNQDGHYVKVGNLVQVSFRIQLSGSGSSNHVRFQGLPINSGNLTNYHAGGIVTYTNIPGISGSGTIAVWQGGNSSLCELYKDGNSSVATGSGGFTNKEIYIVITYRSD